MYNSVCIKYSSWPIHKSISYSFLRRPYVRCTYNARPRTHVGIAFSSCEMIHTKTYEYKVLNLFLLQCTKWLLNLIQRFEFYMFIIMKYFQMRIFNFCWNLPKCNVNIMISNLAAKHIRFYVYRSVLFI
jgi:hypothetical protein